LKLHHHNGEGKETQIGVLSFFYEDRSLENPGGKVRILGKEKISSLNCTC